MKFTKASLTLLGVSLIIPGVCYAGNTLLERNTQLDRNWGRSYETAKYNQILNPKAKENLSPVTGIEGRVGVKIMEDYIKGTPKKRSSQKEIGILTIK